MRRFNVITNLESGAGLRREYEILRTILESAGHRVAGVDFRQVGQIPGADINLFLEVVVERMFVAAAQNWAMPNPEFWLEEYQRILPRLSRVLCKTQHSFKLFRDLVGDRARYVGFMSRDLLQSDVRRKPKFLHLAGNSPFKNTEIILSAWRKLPFQLTLVSGLERFQQQASKLENVRVYGRVSEEKLRYLMNSRQFHLCPSQYEGFGHYIHEAFSVGAIVLTLDAPPMNELRLPAELLMPGIPYQQLRLATLHKMTRETLRDRVKRLVDLSSRRLHGFSRRARDFFDKEREEFPRRFLAVVDSDLVGIGETAGTRRSLFQPRTESRSGAVVERGALASDGSAGSMSIHRERDVFATDQPQQLASTTTRRGMRVFYVGNYEFPFHTEVHLANTLERCGHQVIRHQEQRQGAIDLRLAHESWDLLLWTRTWRGYITQQFLDACKAVGKKTVSYHLDLYLGLRREADMASDSFWRSQYVFTPDGDPVSAKIFAHRGINHFYMPPGVYAPECKKGNWKKNFAHDVIFVGASSNYHANDWPYRAQLVDFLKVRYADRFAAWGQNQTIRNQDLNDLYASAKVAVGDSLCKNFTHENYWSDRVYETTGRGGFIIHPYIKGLENSFHIRGRTAGPEELVTYDFGDFEQLGRLIDHYIKHDSARAEIRDRGHERTKHEHTYDQRMKKMLEIVCG